MAPLTVTKHGGGCRRVDAEEYERLNKLEQLEAPAFNDHLLTIPADDGGAGKGLTGDLRNSDL